MILSEKEEFISRTAPLLDLKREYALIVDYFLRRRPFIKNSRDLIEGPEHPGLEREKLTLPQDTIEAGLKWFLERINYFHSKKEMRWNPDLDKRLLDLNDSLKTIHGIAPVFDLSRGLANLKTLQTISEIINVFPKFNTQMALVVFATDLKAKPKKPLIQRNIRLLTNCSAYAFHRNRNLIEVKFPNVFKEG